MNPDLRFHEFSGDQLEPWIDALGHLRIQVFKEYPYLYEGSLDYERGYLRTYREAPGSRVILVTGPDGGLVGASTCVPLSAEIDEFKAPFLERGIDTGRVLYAGESVVLPEWRGHGLGKEFFRRREARGRALGMDVVAFCAVDRDDDHPLKPPGYRPLDGFWQNLGYRKQPAMKTSLGWRETGGDSETLKSLTFWMKPLEG